MGFDPIKFFLGEDPHYDWEGTYSRDKLAEIFASMPNASMPGGGNVGANLGDQLSWEQDYRWPQLKELLGEIPPISQNYMKTATGNALSRYGKQGSDFAKYQGARGQTVSDELKGDILKKAEENKAKAQRKIGVGGRGMELEGLMRQAAGVGGWGDKTAMANAEARKLGFESQLEMQKFQNEMMALQHQYPAPYQVLDQGSPGLLPQVLPYALPFVGDKIWENIGPDVTRLWKKYGPGGTYGA